MVPPQGPIAVSAGATPALATAGTGDVLTGIIGGLLAAGVGGDVHPQWAAAAGAWLHGRAACLAGTGSSLVASDLITALPRTLSVLTDPTGEK